MTKFFLQIFEQQFVCQKSLYQLSASLNTFMDLWIVWEIGQKFDLVITFDWRVLLKQGQCVWIAFCKIFSGILHLTIFGALKYPPKYGQIHQIRYLGRVFGHDKYGQVGYPWKDLAKCKSEALTLCQLDPPVKIWPIFPYIIPKSLPYAAIGQFSR